MNHTAIADSASRCPVNSPQVRRAVASGRLPKYAETLAAYHRAFAPELRRMLCDAWPTGATEVLDLACGDGAYSAWLADLGGPTATVWAVDISPDWLDVARQSARRSVSNGQIVALAGDALGLPFDNDAFDFIWCAQSLYTLPDTATLLAELLRVLRPGGRLALLEDDTLHQVLLPWDAELELAVRQAELAANRQFDPPANRYYIGRQLSRLVAEARLSLQSKRTYATNRNGPFAGDERIFLEHYLRALRDDTQDNLQRRDRARLDRFITPGEPDCVLDDPHATVTFLDHVVCAEKR